MTDKIIRTSEGLKLVHQMTDRDRLAEKLFMAGMFDHDIQMNGQDTAEWAVKHAVAFFDTLEANADG